MLLLQGCFPTIHHKIHTILPFWLKSVPPPVIPCRPGIQFNGCIPSYQWWGESKRGGRQRRGSLLLLTAIPSGSCGWCHFSVGWWKAEQEDPRWGSVSCRRPTAAARPHHRVRPRPWKQEDERNPGTDVDSYSWGRLRLKRLLPKDPDMLNGLEDGIIRLFRDRQLLTAIKELFRTTKMNSLRIKPEFSDRQNIIIQRDRACKIWCIKIITCCDAKVHPHTSWFIPGSHKKTH